MLFLVVETSRACSAAIDFGKLFSSFFDFFGFSHSQGQERKWPSLSRMSVLPSRADVIRPSQHVRKVPTRDVSPVDNPSSILIGRDCELRHSYAIFTTW